MHHFYTLLFTFLFRFTAALDGNCKCSPSSSCWPSASSWSALNASISGHLIQAVPPASVCYLSQPNYDENKCAYIRSQWFNSSFHADDPIGIDYPAWAKNSCPPIHPNGTSVTGDKGAGERDCSIGDYPVYVVDAREPVHVAKALKWAGERDVRVVVKATGHSHIGRSTGHGSLSIWTHHLRGIEYIPSFNSVVCPLNKTQAAARISAGEYGYTIISELAKHDAVVVVGSDPTVGPIGWLTGGGHGFLSSTYGLGSDNLLAATIVTPTGEIMTASPCENPDLFFAIRGGGGGTYGVVLDVIVKAYPTPKTTGHEFLVAAKTPNITEEFWDFSGWLHTELARLKNGGMQGYYYLLGPPTVPTLTMIWEMAIYDKANGTTEQLMSPILQRLGQEGALFYQSNVTEYQNFYDFYKQLHDRDGEAVATMGLSMGSRLLSKKAFADAKEVRSLLKSVGPSNDGKKPNAPFINPALIGSMIAPTHSPSYFPGLQSANPAWRETLLHFIIAGGWPDGTSDEGIHEVRSDNTFNKTAYLRRLEPNSGVYFNECDAFEPEWQRSFFGPHYERLLEIKLKYDPKSVLWCRGCVGSERWTEHEDGRLCTTG